MTEATAELNAIFISACEEALAQQAKEVSPEHLLMALLDDLSVKKLIKSKFTLKSSDLKKKLSLHFMSLEDEQTDGIFDHKKMTYDSKIIDLIKFSINLSKGDKVSPTDLLESFIQKSDTYAGTLLRNHGIVPEKDYKTDKPVENKSLKNQQSQEIEDPVSYDIGIDQNSGNIIILPKKEVRSEEKKEIARPGGDFLQQYTTNLNQAAIDHTIHPVIGRNDEINAMIEILLLQKKNNPLVVGESGVGKTAIAEGLAQRIVTKNVPRHMQNKVIYALDMTALIAGTTLRGEFEERLKGVVDEISQDPDAILMIDEFHMMVDLGDSGATNLIKPALQNGQLRCIALTTYDEYRKFIEKDPALARRFNKVDVKQPTPEQTIDIITQSIDRYEQQHNVRYQAEAIKTAVELSARYFPHKNRPDIVFDIIDIAGVKNYLHQQTLTTTRRGTVKSRDIENAVASMKKMPAQNITRNDRAGLNSLEEKLNGAVFDQEEAAKTLASAIRLAKSGLNNPDKPVGSFLFQGPTGVGKTEIAKKLSEILELELIRFDMSEYMESHAVARLIGSPPGYVGYDKGGLLTEAIDRHPRSILLLDEIEKAHPDIYNLFLQAMDHGAVTDNNGKKIDFRHTLIIMTTNAGSAESKTKPIGFTSNSTAQQRTDESVARLFKPEFRNRLDATIHFHSLKESTVVKVADKFLHQLAIRAQKNNVILKWTQAATTHLAHIGFDPEMNARPMERTIKNKIAKPLSDEMIEGKLKNGGTMTIDFNAASSCLTFNFDDAAQKTKRKSTQSTTMTPTHK